MTLLTILGLWALFGALYFLAGLALDWVLRVPSRPSIWGE